MVRLGGEKLIARPTRTVWVTVVYPVAEALIVADPKLIPFTRICVLEVTEPAAMFTLTGVMVTFVVSLLDSVIVTPPAGAGIDRLTEKAVDWPGPTVTLAGRIMFPGLTTVTVAFISGMLGRELARMMDFPSATLVTGTVTLVAFAAKVALAGTVATVVSLELKLTINPPVGAGAERFNVRF